jgi:hypothetical protein
MADKKYRWANAQEWLVWAYDNGKVTASELLHIVIEHVDGDDIQDEFQADMDAAGFFDELEPDYPDDKNPGYQRSAGDQATWRE